MSFGPSKHPAQHLHMGQGVYSLPGSGRISGRPNVQPGAAFRPTSEPARVIAEYADDGAAVDILKRGNRLWAELRHNGSSIAIEIDELATLGGLFMRAHEEHGDE